MKILNFGSINIDHVYRVPHFVQPGETLNSLEYRRFPGGKGFNQSVALARAGAAVSHAGAIGHDGLWLAEYLQQCGVDTNHIAVTDTPTGHALIHVDEKSGQNAILLDGGANRKISATSICPAMTHFTTADMFLTQNETSAVPDAIRAAKAQGMTVAFNPAPMDTNVDAIPLDLVDILFVNELEGAALAGTGVQEFRSSGVQNEEMAEVILSVLRRRFPKMVIVLTLGKEGVMVSEPFKDLTTATGTSPLLSFHIPALPVTAVDTTAAGDCFIGYFLAATLEGRSPRDAATLATRAAALTVTRPGAASSIPSRAELE